MTSDKVWAMAEQSDRTVVPSEIVSGDGSTPIDGDSPPTEQGSDAEYLSSPAKLMRIGSMIKQVLEEIHKSELDEASRDQLRDMYQQALDELQTALGEELGEELDRIAIDLGGDDVPSEAQLRVAKAQLIGWMEGVFHGIQAALIAQQAEARHQLQGMRAEIQPPESGMPTGGPGYL